MEEKVETVWDREWIENRQKNNYKRNFYRDQRSKAQSPFSLETPADYEEQKADPQPVVPLCYKDRQLKPNNKEDELCPK